jgi:hypothetical protein
MRFTEHELTVAVTAAAKTVASARRPGLRKGRGDAAWDAMSRLERYQVLEAIGGQLLPVLAALPDVEVASGTRPTFTDAQVVAAVTEQVGDEGGRLRRKATILARAALVRTALNALPPRSDPDALVVPDSM